MRFDSDTAQKFVDAIKLGASNELAAQHAEVELSTIRKWLRGGTPKTAEFKTRVDKARADMELLAVGQVRRRMTDDKGAAMWIAERAHNEQEFERLRELTT